MTTSKDCSVETIFPNAVRVVAMPAKGFAINSGGPGRMDTKSPVWDVTRDPLQVPGCVLVLTKFLDGSPITVRYHRHDVYRYVARPW